MSDKNPVVPPSDDVEPAAQIRPDTPEAREPAATDPATPSRKVTGIDDRGRVRQSKVSALWFSMIVTALLLVLVLIFVAQNSRQVEISYLGWNGQISLAIALVLAAVAGILLVAIPGSIRILQLSRALRKNEKAARRAERG